MTNKYLGIALAFTIMSSSATVVVAQGSATETRSIEDDPDRGNWGLLGLLGLGGLFGLKRRDTVRNDDTGRRP